MTEDWMISTYIYKNNPEDDKELVDIAFFHTYTECSEFADSIQRSFRHNRVYSVIEYLRNSDPEAVFYDWEEESTSRFTVESLEDESHE